MIALDPIVSEFIAKNIFTISLVLALLKGFSRVSKWEWDNKVMDVICEVFATVTRRVNPNGNGETKRIEGE